MSMIKATPQKQGSELELYEYDAGELKPEDVEVGSITAVSAIPICR